MALAPGTSLGHYDVTALLGEGGMGQVWQATDTQLNRQVALKILPDAFADDPDRLARFTREAQILASLNHPNIAAIHGIEESEGTRALVLELVEGPTLADRIAQGAIPLDEALPIAEALEAAHEAGVIHRDLKPANIKVRDDGTVKVLDFGLAKAVQPDVPAAVLSDSPTVTATVGGTRQGVILGTAAYMSPEQARGKPLDRRTDIWSFGCVLYEMLAGRAAYVGNTLSDTLVNILDRDPDWAALPPDTPRWLRTLLQRCLRKQTTRRLRHIGDAQLELDEAPAERSVESAAPVAVSGHGAFAVATPWVVAALLAVTAGVSWTRSPVPNPLAVVRTSIPLPPGQRVPGIGHPLAISPNGRTLAYITEAGTTRLYLRSLDETDVRLVPQTDGARQPFFSPDSEWVGFWADGILYRVPVTGGQPLPTANVPELGLSGFPNAILGPFGVFRE